MRTFLIVLSLLFMTVSTAEAAVVTREVQYKDGDVSLTGYIAWDNARAAGPKDQLPGVLIFPEWWGVTDYVKGRARQIAELGYIAFVADMYENNKTAATPDEAKALSKPFYDDRNLMRRRAAAALVALKQEANVNVENLGAIGYCFGGTNALEMARDGADLKGVVSFHGGLTTTQPAKASVVKAQVLALNGGADPFSPQADKDAFAKEMQAAGVTYKSIDYPGATHAFTNPEATEKGKKFNMPIAYNAEADKASFEEMKNFFARLFKQ